MALSPVNIGPHHTVLEDDSSQEGGGAEIFMKLMQKEIILVCAEEVYFSCNFNFPRCQRRE